MKAKVFSKDYSTFYCLWSCSGEDEFIMDYMVKVGELHHKQPAVVLEISSGRGEKVRLLTPNKEVGWISRSIVELLL